MKRNWRGALAMTYHIGPGPAEVHLKVASNWDIKPIYDVIDRYAHVLAAFQSRSSPALSTRALEQINADLLRVSRLFLDQKGLPDRPWFKNQIYAPGAYTGYGAKPIAAVREYMDEKRWKHAEAQVPQVARVIESVAAGVNKAAEDFENELAHTH
jgi:N-acetylated-alpha-linked acidic dipeptidase